MDPPKPCLKSRRSQASINKLRVRRKGPKLTDLSVYSSKNLAPKTKTERSEVISISLPGRFKNTARNQNENPQNVLGHK